MEDASTTLVDDPFISQTLETISSVSFSLTVMTMDESTPTETLTLSSLFETIKDSMGNTDFDHFKVASMLKLLNDYIKSVLVAL